MALFVSISIVYLAGSFVIKKNVGSERFEIARTLSLEAADNIQGEVADAESYASRLLWKEECRRSNLKYSGLDKADIEKKMLDIDKIWVSAAPDSDLIRKHTSGAIPDSMREIVNMRGLVSEMFITDKFGGIIFASGKTSDFYQADEDWWKKAYNEGKGFTYFGPMEYDTSCGKWGSAIATPIIDHDGNVIGICKIFTLNEKLFGFINEFRMGMTGHALLVDNDGTILIHKSISPLMTKIMDSASFKKLKKSTNGYVSTQFGINHKGISVAAVSTINSKTLAANKIGWNIIVLQEAGESLRTLSVFLVLLFGVALFFIPLTVPIGMFLGSRISKPIDELSRIAGHIAAGDLEQKIDIHTGDEIEQFSRIFETMIKNLKDNQDKLLAAKKSLEELSLAQEDTIKVRTMDLTKAQEAMLNILEDLVGAKERLEKYSQDLEKAVQIKSDFTSTVSHELRTPLAAIKEGIAIVLDGTAGEISAGQKEFLEIAKRNVDRLARLINDILDFQKLEAGKMGFNMVQNDINETIKDAANAMYPIVEKKQLELILDLDSEITNMTFDRDKITQVLTNLISNAVKYTEKGSIKIRAERENNLLKVSVTDTGIGIKPEDIPRLFTQFTQLEKIADRKTGSTGLGLSICRDIIRAHNGKIWAESEYGKGSSFIFIIPIVDRRARNV